MRAITEFSLSLFKVVLRSRSETQGVVSPAKLQTSITLRAKNKSFKQILNRRGHETVLFRIPWVNFDQERKEESI